MFFIGLFALLSATAFAEGDVVCSGRVMGSTTNFNANFGKLYFDSHGAPAGGIPAGYESKYDQVVDISILDDGIPPDETTGLAPADRADAACVSEAIGNFSHDGVTLNNYGYQVEKYAWSDNLGFIDFLGSETFGVKIGPNVAGTRELAGYAWSGSGAGPTFGYIQFKGLQTDLTPYGVTMNSATGMLSGYAWSDAGIWIDFTGIQIELPDEEIPIAVEGICGGVEYLCVDVSIYEGINDYWYDLEVYLMEDDGVTPLDLSTYDFSADFIWEDTVKLNQLAYSTGDFSNDPMPVKNGGGVLKKPLSVADSDEFLKLFEEVGVKTGHYQLKDKIKSLAPTSGSNVSLTTSTLPPLAISNEFFADELSINGAVWTDAIEPNELILKRIDYEITKGGLPVAGEPVYPGGLGSGYRLEFTPVIDVGVLYAGDHEDTIIGFRNVPISFTMKESHRQYQYLKYSDAEVYAMLAYDETETQSECSDKDEVDFDYYFTDENLDAIAVSHAGHGDWSFASVTPDPYANAVKFALGDLASEQVYNAVAALPAYDPEDPEAGLPCDVIQGPTLYTVVKYEASLYSKTVYYYGNKVPRILSAAYNPAAIIHGNVYAPKAFSPTASHEIQETGYLAVNVVRNTINENINKYLGEIELSGGGACEIIDLREDGRSKIDYCASDKYKEFDVGDEHVLFFNETEVTLNMGVPGADSNFLGNWVIIVQDAPVFIDSDLYHDNPADGKLVLISMSTYDGSCDVNNIYLHADVKNIDANIIADCSLFPYHPDVAMPGADGIPDWSFEDKIAYLDNQKLFRGSIASRNTIGGADLDSLAGKEYLLFGTGEVAELPVDLDTRLDAQNYDFNYMAFFMLSVEIADNGWPIDQRCQKALTIDDMVAINNGVAVYGEAVDEFGDPMQCDGIDLMQFDPNTLDGDLVVAEEDSDKLARGLDAESDFNPVYIYAVTSGSFVFEKSGEVTSWN